MKAKTTQKLVFIPFFLINLLLSFGAKAQLKADFLSSSTTGCSPFVVYFQDNSTGNPVQWKWDLGNGTTSVLQNPSVSYITPGTYSVKLVIKNASGTADSIVKNQYVTVFANPVLNFAATPTNGCYPLKVQFTDAATIASNSGTITQWQWDLGDGTLSTLQNPTHTYTSMGNFDIKLKVTTDKGCFKILNKPAYVKVDGGVKADFSYSAQGTNCQPPTPVSFTNKSLGTGNLSYVWWFGDGATSTAINPTHSYVNTGSYTVTLITTNSSGCSDTIVKTNAVNVGAVKANFTSPDTACAGAAINLVNTSTPAAVAANWSFSDGTTSAIVSPIKIFTSAGVYQIKLVNSFGVCSDSLIKQIVVLSKPTANFTSTNNLACAAPVTVQFNNTSTGAVSYTWDFGNNTGSAQQNPIATYTSVGTYTTSLLVKGANGCTDTISKTGFVQIVAPVIDSIHVTKDKGCVPLLTKFTAHLSSVQSIAQYSWDFGDGGTSMLPNPTYTYTSTGKYTVTLTITTTGGCTISKTFSDFIVVGNRPTANFVGTPTEICAQNSASFTDLSTGGPIDKWEWQFGDGGVKFTQNPSYQYNDTGYFTVMLMVFNNGCSDTLIKPKYIHVNPPIAKFGIHYGDCDNRLFVNFKDSSLGATTYSWDFGDGSTSTAVNPNHTYSNSGTYAVALTVSNGTCSHTKTRTVVIDNNKGTLKVSTQVACRKTDVKLYVDSANTSISAIYNFDFGDGVNRASSTPDYVFQYNQPGNYFVSVAIDYNDGCKDTLRLQQPVVIYGPTANFFAEKPAYCAGSTVQFIDSSKADGTHPITNWSWNYGDNNVVNYTSAPFAHVYNAAGNYAVKLKITDSYGCTDSITKPSVTIYQAIAKFIESDTLVCPNTFIQFTDSSSGNNLSHHWDFGDGSTSSAIHPSHQYMQQGVYTIKLAVKDNFGCSDALVKVNRIRVFYPVASFNLSDSFAVCPPLLVNITNNSLNAGSSSWSFGDGGISSLTAPSHIYVYPGNYTVKLIVTNVGGCADSTTKTVYINGPTGTFTYSPKIGCAPLQVNFNSVTQNSIKNTWDFSNGATAITSGNSTTYNYTLMGDYVPKLILEDAQGCKVPIVGADTIKVKDIQAIIAVPLTRVCDSGYVNFYDASLTNDTIVNYVWNFGDGTSSNNPKPNHHYTKNGTYNVSLNVTTQTGCKSAVVVNQQVKVLPSPKATITADSSICRYNSLLFTASWNNPDTSTIAWKWDFANGNTATIQNPPAQTYNTPGVFNVQNIIVSSNGCADTSYKKLTVHALPNVDAGVDTFICRNQVLNLKATGALAYTWTANTTLSCLNCASPVAKPLASVMYKVMGKDAHNCVATDSIFVTVQQRQPISVSKNDTLCLGKSITAQAFGTDNYVWSPATYLNTNIGNTVIVKPTIDTAITYTIVGKDKYNCFSDTGYVKVKAYPIPKFGINLAELTINAGTSIKLQTTNSKDITKWKWTPNKYLDNPNTAEPNVIGKESINYICIASNEGKCTAQDEIKVTVLCNGANVFIPNTFSPNADGNNDLFYPRGKGLFSIRNFRIFNRWGEVVFERNNFQANDPAAAWDGTTKGVKQPSDTYVYSLEVICDNNTSLPVKGNITLLR